jgi:hypothetical protein
LHCRKSISSPKKFIAKGIHHIKGKNQYETIASVTIDFRDQVRPTITFVTESGTVITNISKEGKDWQKKYTQHSVRAMKHF